MKPFINDAEFLESFLELLGTPTRMKILDLISKEPHYISEISQLLSIGQQSITRHLQKLEEFGLISYYTEKAWRSRIPRHYYQVNPGIDIVVHITSDGVSIEHTNKSVTKNKLNSQQRNPSDDHPDALQREKWGASLKAIKDLQEKVDYDNPSTSQEVLSKMRLHLQQLFNLLDTPSAYT